VHHLGQPGSQDLGDPGGDASVVLFPLLWVGLLAADGMLASATSPRLGPAPEGLSSP
jgi:hypothetical protein